ncbi:conserved hypothetical protein [Ricinus communis]|uniref:Uncharacterized protein n=1 Tax=Ricinus communis TaxID=3988 RepID=B9SJG1_RICCO|nr:conserved hypothetical protein [Ricinus communis]
MAKKSKATTSGVQQNMEEQVQMIEQRNQEFMKDMMQTKLDQMMEIMKTLAQYLIWRHSTYNSNNYQLTLEE